MNFTEFKNTILIMMQKKHPDKTISIQQIHRNNQVIYDALVMYECQNDCAPTIYLIDYYKDFCKGSPLNQIIDSILAFYDSQKADSQFDVSFFYSFDQAKDKIIFKLINYSKNKELLETIPYVRYLDLAIVFYCTVDSNLFSQASILIQNHHISFWNTNKASVLHYAKKNTPSLFPSEFKKIYDIFQENSNGSFSKDFFLDAQENITCNIPMYVLTNLNKTHGAACILYENMLSKISSTLESDYYILPSSIHELIIIPVKSNARYQELSEMVSSINASQLAYEEILSDHVYFYSRKTNTLSM